MKPILLSTLLIISLAGQSQDRLNELFATTAANQSAVEASKNRVDIFVESYKGSQMSDKKLLRSAFRKMHSTFLKKYSALADFDKIFETGTYDCLTATALFSHVLDRLDYSYEIIETNYHIFLMVKTSQGDVLLETTDRFGGFITDKNIIAKRAGDYRSNELISNVSEKKYAYSFKLYQSISPQKLTGLMFFNQAVKAYNKHDWISCAALIEKSYSLYESPRCNELGSLVIQTVSEKSSDEKIRESCLTHLKNIYITKAATLAAY